MRKAGEGGDQKIYQKLVPIKKLAKETITDEDEEEIQVVSLIKKFFTDFTEIFLLSLLYQKMENFNCVNE